jgi:hypothetical protein
LAAYAEISTYAAEECGDAVAERGPDEMAQKLNEIVRNQVAFGWQGA